MDTEEKEGATTTTRQGVWGDGKMPGSVLVAECGGADGNAQRSVVSWQSDPQDVLTVTASPGGPRRKRRRQRTQRGERQRPPQGRAGQVEGASRERIFQDLEGLLRQIREEAEEWPTVAEEHINHMAHAVSAFTKALEEQSDPIPQRTHSEYQRIREKLVRTLRGDR